MALPRASSIAALGDTVFQDLNINHLVHVQILTPTEVELPVDRGRYKQGWMAGKWGVRDTLRVTEATPLNSRDSGKTLGHF